MLLAINSDSKGVKMFPEMAKSSEQSNCLLDLLTSAQPHQPAGDVRAVVRQQLFAQSFSRVVMPLLAVFLPGPFVNLVIDGCFAYANAWFRSSAFWVTLTVAVRGL